MPAIAMFYGLIVYMYFRDNQQHHVPHIHVRYAEHQVIVSIPEGEVLSGALPRKQMRLLLAWIELREAELMADWMLAVEGNQPYEIKPL
jgi:hypothetical protein